MKNGIWNPPKIIPKNKYVDTHLQCQNCEQPGYYVYTGYDDINCPLCGKFTLDWEEEDEEFDLYFCTSCCILFDDGCTHADDGCAFTIRNAHLISYWIEIGRAHV